MGKQTFELTDNDINYRKSNVIIDSKYRGTLFDNKVLAAALCKIQKGYEYSEKSNNIICTFEAQELKKFLKEESNSDFYRDINNVALKLMNKVIGITHSDDQKFYYEVLVVSSKYENGRLELQFNGNLENLLRDIATNYTSLSLKILFSFKNNYAFRLYENLMSRTYGKYKIADGIYRYELSVAELKFIFGVAEIFEAERYLGQKHPDYNSALEKVKDKKYDKFYDFKRYCIEPAVNEINEKAPIKVTYSTKRKNRNIDSIVFVTEINAEEEKAQANHKDTESKKKTKNSTKNLFPPEVTQEAIDKITKMADGDEDMIREAVGVMSLKKGIKNPAGWLISYIKRKTEEDDHEGEEDYDDGKNLPKCWRE